MDTQRLIVENGRLKQQLNTAVELLQVAMDTNHVNNQLGMNWWLRAHALIETVRCNEQVNDDAST